MNAVWEIFDFAWGDPGNNPSMGDDDDENASDAPPLAIMDGRVSDDEGDEGGESGAADSEPVPAVREGESDSCMPDGEDVAVVPDDSQDIFMDPLPNDSVTQEIPIDSQENQESPMNSQEVPVDPVEVAVENPNSKEIPMDSQEEGPMWTDLADSQPDPRPPAVWDDLTKDSPDPGSTTDRPEQPGSASTSMPPPPPRDPEVMKRKMEIRARMEELRLGLQSMSL